jgi:hypothetical protein
MKFDQFEPWEFEVNEFIAQGQAMEDEEAMERYAGFLIEQGREDELVDGMPAWWYMVLECGENE